MGQYRLQLISSTSQLRDRAGAWDDLWMRSDVALPTARAELIAQWLDRFAPKAEVRRRKAGG
jgi:hypothetical protein